MPITPTKLSTDPCARLAWTTSVVILALEKLRRLITLSGEERNAIERIAQELELLFKASKITVDEFLKGKINVLPANLHNSFFTLVAIKEKSLSTLNLTDFEQAGENLQSIKQHVISGDIQTIDSAIIEQSQKVCLELLEHLNKQRPSSIGF